MKLEHKALIFTLALGALIPSCVVVGEKPADSAPPVAAAPEAKPAGAASATPAPVAAASAAANPMSPAQPPALLQAPSPKLVSTAPVATEPAKAGTTP